MKLSLKKVTIAISATFLTMIMASCGSTKLYSWYDYQEDYYNYVKNSDEKSLNNLIKNYEKIIEKQKDSRKIVPPGIYADYGFALLEARRNEEAKAMFAKEIELYPESEVFISSLIKRSN